MKTWADDAVKRTQPLRNVVTEPFKRTRKPATRTEYCPMCYREWDKLAGECFCGFNGGGYPGDEFGDSE